MFFDFALHFLEFPRVSRSDVLMGCSYDSSLVASWTKHFRTCCLWKHSFKSWLCGPGVFGKFVETERNNYVLENVNSAVVPSYVQKAAGSIFSFTAWSCGRIAHGAQVCAQVWSCEDKVDYLDKIQQCSHDFFKWAQCSCEFLSCMILVYGLVVFPLGRL